jgi:hypothetical protein
VDLRAKDAKDGREERESAVVEEFVHTQGLQAGAGGGDGSDGSIAEARQTPEVECGEGLAARAHVRVRVCK